MNPDIKEERDKVDFNVEEFTNWFHGGAAEVKQKRFLGKNFVTSKVANFVKFIELSF